MYNSLTLWVAEIHQKEQRKKAEMRRRFEEIYAPRESWNQRFGLALSGLLITAGEKLRQRYDPDSPCSCYESL